MARPTKYGERLTQTATRWRVDQLEKVDALAEMTGKTRNEMMRDLIDMALDEMKKEKTL